MNSKIPLTVFGEVLFDCFPDGSRVLGGAPFNVAWHLQAFGLFPRFISRVGTDPYGSQIRDSMARWGMDLEGLQNDSRHPTGRVEISLASGEPSYDIVADCAYDFIAPEELPSQNSRGILYHGSLATRHPISATALNVLKSRHQGKIFVDVNLRDPWWNLESIHGLMNDAHWVKLNENELTLLCPDVSEFEAAMEQCGKRFSLDLVIVTRGALGAVVWSREGTFSVKPDLRAEVVDTVGAGDAFASAFLLGLCQGWSIQTILEHAQAFAGELVTRRGATIHEHSVYSAFLEQWRSHQQD